MSHDHEKCQNFQADEAMTALVFAEMQKQRDKWGEQSHPDGTGMLGSEMTSDWAKRSTALKAENGTVTWKDILREEYYEALAEQPDSVALERKLVQVAAVAMSWVRDLQARREARIAPNLVSLRYGMPTGTENRG